MEPDYNPDLEKLLEEEEDWNDCLYDREEILFDNLKEDEDVC
jgi:hypothetical protein